MSEKLGLMICGHGSRNKGAVKQFAQLAEGLTARFPDWPVEYGYLEFANPVIHDGLNKLREAGCTRVLAVHKIKEYNAKEEKRIRKEQKSKKTQVKKEK